MHRSVSLFKKGPMVALPSRTITDIPWYKRTDSTHLHLVDGRSTRRKFEMKLEKLEKDRVAADRLRHSPKLPLHPSQLKPLELPLHVERGPSDVLRAIAGCLKRDFTGPDYIFHDDPYLIPYNSISRRDFIMSKQGGKQAARFVFAQHPELFEKNLIEMEPKIPKFTPKMKVTEKNATVPLLQSLVEACNVSDAIETYDFLKQKNVQVDPAVKLSYLEMLCFHNSETEEMPEEYMSYYSMVKTDKMLWKHGGVADHLAAEIIASGHNAHEARLALMLGKSKFHDHLGVLQIYDEIKAYSGQMDTYAYNAVLLAKALGSCNDWNEVKHILELMNAESIGPDRTTLENVLAFLFKQSAGKDMTSLTLSVLAEFNSLEIKPSLGAYREVLRIFAKTKKKLILKDILRELLAVQKEKGTLLYEMNGENCFQFFRECMTVCGSLPELAPQINDLVMADPNHEVLLGGYNNKMRFFKIYFTILVNSAPLDTTMELLNLYTPHIWTPTLDFYKELLKAIEAHSASQFLPKLWTDLIESNFATAKREFKMEFIAQFGNAVLSLGSKEDPSMNKTFAGIADNMFRLLSARYMYLNSSDLVHDAKVCNNIVQMGIQSGNYSVAKDVVKFCKDQVTVMPDNLESRVMEQFVSAMIDANEVDEAYRAIIFTNDLGFQAEAEELAVAAASKLAFEPVQKRTLNNLYSSSSKWVMLS